MVTGLPKNDCSGKYRKVKKSFWVTLPYPKCKMVYFEYLEPKTLVEAPKDNIIKEVRGNFVNSHTTISILKKL